MELRHLKYFVMAAEELSISSAAARLNVSQPAVSRQIKSLEEELGVVLFLRESRGLSLTQAGQLALPLARDLLRRSGDLRLAMEAFKRPTRSSLRVGFIAPALPGFLAGAMRKFNRMHGEVCLQIREMSPQQQERALRAGEIDLALLGSACPELASEFEVEAIEKVPMAVVLPDDHLFALRKSIDLEELENEPFVSLRDKHFPGRAAMLADLCRRAGFVPDVRQKAEGLQEMLGLVSGGGGVGVLPANVDQLPHPGVVFVPMSRPRLELVFSVAWNRAGETKALLQLVDLLKSEAGGGKP